jgi:outer membrane murein-binding lipoprotein Lpp
VRKFVLPAGSRVVTVGVVQHRRLTWIVAVVVAAVVLNGCTGADSFDRSSSRVRPTIVVEHGALCSSATHTAAR